MEFNASCEPMDIDLSSNSVSAMDVSYGNNSSKLENTYENSVKSMQPAVKSNFKKLAVDLDTKQTKAKIKNNTVLSVLGLILLILSTLVYHLKANFNCCETFDTDKLKIKFSNRLYGQSTAVGEIIEILESASSIKMLIMFGGTGVGKTLTTSIMLEDLLHFTNVYHYTMPTFVESVSTSLMLGVTLCKSSIIVVDDLKNDDMLEVKKIVNNIIIRSQNFNKNLTIILVYNCDTYNKYSAFKCESSFVDQLKQNFSDIEVSKKFIEFSQLDQNTLRRCIEYELGNTKIDETLLTNFLKHFNVGQDGCKGVHKKINYLNRI